MKQFKFLFIVILVLLLATTESTVSAQTLQTLWQIGTRDRANAEFALAPKSYKDFQTDGSFVVGASQPNQDWPYAHPGPGDGWGGTRRHTFTIVFGLKP